MVKVNKLLQHINDCEFTPQKRVTFGSQSLDFNNTLESLQKQIQSLEIRKSKFEFKQRIG